MERANTITYLKGETIGTETRRRAIKSVPQLAWWFRDSNSGPSKSCQKIETRLHVTQLSIVCPFKYLVYMKRQREERPKKIYYTGHEVEKLFRRTISPWETTNAIPTEPEGGFQLRTMPQDMRKGESLTAAAVIPGGTLKDIWSSQNEPPNPRECLWPLGKAGGL